MSPEPTKTPRASEDEDEEEGDAAHQRSLQMLREDPTYQRALQEEEFQREEARQAQLAAKRADEQAAKTLRRENRNADWRALSQYVWPLVCKYKKFIKIHSQ